jgi:hypothetical protein
VFAPDELKKWREAQEPKLSFDAAGAKVGVSGSAWFDWENGNKVPTVDLVEDLEKLTEGAVTVPMWAEVSRGRRAEQKAERDAKKHAKDVA